MSNGNGRYPGNRFGSPMNDPRQQDPVTTDESVRSIKRPLGVSTIITRRFALNRAPSISPPADSRYTGDSQRSPQTDLPPWLFPPFGATPLDEPQDRRPVNVAAAGTLIITIPSTPAGRIGIIRKLGLSSSDMTNTRVTTRSDNDPVYPYPGTRGVIGTLETPFDLAAPIIILPGHAFSVTVDNVGAVAITVAMRLVGWFY